MAKDEDSEERNSVFNVPGSVESEAPPRSRQSAHQAPRRRGPSARRFPATGAEVFAAACVDEGLAALFCCPGNYQVVRALVEAGVPCYSGRHEGYMAAAADGFIRATGQIAACSGTKGPGFSNMVTSVATAFSARTPLLVLADHNRVTFDDSEYLIQSVPHGPMLSSVTKFQKRILTKERVHDYAGYAFRHLRTGIPAPVHLDFPPEVGMATIEKEEDLYYYYSKDLYRTEAQPHPDPYYIEKLVAMIEKAKRPLIVSSTGVFYSRAWDPLKTLAEKADIAVVESGAMRGQFSDLHPLSVSRAPDALMRADLVILVGQYCMPSIFLGEWEISPEACIVRIDPDPTDIGRNTPIDLGIVSNEKAALELLAQAVPHQERSEWRAEIAQAKEAFEAENERFYRLGLSYKEEGLHPAVISHDLAQFLARPEHQGAGIVPGGFGFARYVRRWILAQRPAQLLSPSYQYGTVGLDIAYAFGLGVAMKTAAFPQAGHEDEPIICTTGDAGFGMSALELSTFARYQVPVVVIVYNNNCWGTWFVDENSPAEALHDFPPNLRYEYVAKAFGGTGEYVQRPEEFMPALERCYALSKEKKIPTVINCQGSKKFWSKSAFPPGFLDKTEPGCMSYHH